MENMKISKMALRLQPGRSRKDTSLASGYSHKQGGELGHGRRVSNRTVHVLVRIMPVLPR